MPYLGIHRTHMKKKTRKYKSAESKAREKAHQFGQPGGNPTYDPALAVNQREFDRWAESTATEKDLRDYIADETHPFARRRFCEALIANTELDEMFALTNQTHGAPKQPIEVQSLPKVQCEFFGNE